MIINEEEFRSLNHATVIFRNVLPPHFENNCWYISLNSTQLNEVAYSRTPAFLKMYEYGRKMKDAMEKDDTITVLFKQNRHLTADELKVLYTEVAEHEKAYQTVSRSNGSEIIEILEDYDASDL
jgi:hypothetical protein